MCKDIKHNVPHKRADVVWVYVKPKVTDPHGVMKLVDRCMLILGDTSRVNYLVCPDPWCIVGMMDGTGVGARH